MSRRYRNELPQLDAALSTLERAAREAFGVAQDDYPPGASCIVRSQRYGHHVVERRALIVSTTVDLHIGIDGKPWASVSIRARNLKTGKHRVFYPSVEVAGQPSVRAMAGAE
ncbi:hypothetical protein A7X74_10915 [Stenotrophomonas maltophilia]|uniref:hypothetical protein n=1 Tax=Stenotrophomonas maltophilia TaxID=40324 RepID=UPI000DA75FF8|nr:hypothetical protein [Stenotrophomonas maltophilia]PZS80533.1 hypothetical protein A7X74_10915 [Stenotrophomonas maltophilia]